MASLKICWISDTHLDVPSELARKTFYEKIYQSQADAIFLTGDIADGLTLTHRLKELLSYCNKNIYFVLGNHDYFHREVNSVCEEVRALCQQHIKLVWMNEVDHVLLDDNVALLGVDGWADGRYGDYENSFLSLLDSRYIADYVVALQQGRDSLLKKMQWYADQDGKLLENKLNSVTDCEKIIVLTHVPPFPQSSWHHNQPSDDNALPYFASKATGDVLRNFALQHPNIQLQVYCGHSHCYQRYQATQNLIVETADAKTGEPAISDVIFLKRGFYV